MAMNFLKILHRGGESSDGGGAGAASSRAAAASRKRVYTPSEVEATNQLRFLLAKMETLTLPEDRRATMEQLTQTPVDAAGVRTLLNLSRAIQSDRQSHEHIDLSLQAVEVIKILLTPHATSAVHPEEDGATAPAAVANSALVSLFVQTPAYITSLLELLEERHSVLRLYTIQCLTSLLMARTEKIQSIVLNHPMGVILLVELLSDSSEVIRNETLLLLEALTRANAPIQKIVAFNGAFEKLLVIAEEEMHLNGGVIAEDAMRLVASLLAENTSNQFLFLEQGCVSRLIPYISFRETDLDDDAGPGFEFLGLALEIVGHLTSCIDYATDAPTHKNTSSRHALAPLVQPLLSLACAPPPAAPPVAVRHDAWSLLAMVIDGHQRNQAILEAFRVTVTEQVAPVQTTQQQAQMQLQYPNYAYDPQHNPYVSVASPPAPSVRQVARPALRHLLDLACDVEDALERFLLIDIVRAYFAGNAPSQLRAIMSFAPSPTAVPRGARQEQGDHDAAAQESEEEDGSMVGPTLLGMLGGARPTPDTFESGPEGSAYADRCRWVASAALMHMLADNRDAQVMLLTLPMSDAAASGGTPARLVDYFIGALFASQNHGAVEPSLLSLLCVWADGCSEVNETIFSKYAANLLAYLVQMARDPNVQQESAGLATYYLAIVLELASNPPQPITPTSRSAGASAAVAAFSSTVITAATMMDVITKQVTLERFKANLAALQASRAFQQAEAIKDARAANPLFVYRRMQEEWVVDNASTVDSSSAALSPDRESEKLTALVSLLHSSLAFSHAFTRRFKAINDRCDQRLLHLFTSAAGAATMSTMTHATHASAAPAHVGATPTTAIDARLAPNANGEVEQQMRALKEENARLKQDAALLQSASNGSSGDAIHQLQQLQSELHHVKQQLHQSQAEVRALRAGQSTAAAPASSDAAHLPPADGDLATLRREFAELLSEHEDLLILLASQEIELEAARRPTTNEPQNHHAAAAATATDDNQAQAKQTTTNELSREGTTPSAASTVKSTALNGHAEPPPTGTHSHDLDLR